MSYNLNSTLLLVGTGEMAFEYAKVLKALNTKFLVVGRSATSAELFFN